MNIAIINPIFRTANLGRSLFLKGISPVPTQEVSEINIVERARELTNLGNNDTVYVADAFVEFDELHLSDRLTIRSVPAMLQRIFLPAIFPFTPGLAFSSKLREADVIQSGDFYQFSTFSASNLAAREQIPFFVWQEAFHYMRPPAKPFQQLFNLTAGRSIRATTYKFILRTKKAKNFLNEIGVKPSAIGPWIPTGIDGESFQPRPGALNPEDFGFPDDFALVLLVARLTPSKGVDLAIRAEAILRKKGIKVGLLVRGSGPELNNLKALAKELKIDGYVRFLGSQSRLEMADLYNSSDVFLLASRMDLFPFALLEAAGCGLPSVATRVGCVEDFVQDSVNGLLASPNSEDLAKGIEKLLCDNDLRERLGKEARRCFVKDIDMRVVAHHLEELYKMFSE
jgi:glycosyltransferase involved in cell wall biosynthesis